MFVWWHHEKASRHRPRSLSDKNKQMKRRRNRERETSLNSFVNSDKYDVNVVLQYDNRYSVRCDWSRTQTERDGERKEKRWRECRDGKSFNIIFVWKRILLRVHWIRIYANLQYSSSPICCILVSSSRFSSALFRHYKTNVSALGATQNFHINVSLQQQQRNSGNGTWSSCQFFVWIFHAFSFSFIIAIQPERAEGSVTCAFGRYCESTAHFNAITSFAGDNNNT